MMTKMSKLKENVRKFSIQKNLNFTSSQLLFPLLRHQTSIGEHFSTLNNRKFQSPVLLLLRKKKKESLLKMPLKAILSIDIGNMEDHFHNRTLVQQVQSIFRLRVATAHCLLFFVLFFYWCCGYHFLKGFFH